MPAETTTLPNAELKRVLKQAMNEVLHENRELLYEVFEEVLEDFGLAEAIREGKKSDPVTREEVCKLLEGRK